MIPVLFRLLLLDGVDSYMRDLVCVCIFRSLAQSLYGAIVLYILKTCKGCIVIFLASRIKTIVIDNSNSGLS